MQNPIPSPRPSSDPLYRTLPCRQPLVGPACVTCVHPSCRERRAERLPRLGGHRSEYASEHTQAARVQARYRHLVIWWGKPRDPSGSPPPPAWRRPLTSTPSWCCSGRTLTRPPPAPGPRTWAAPASRPRSDHPAPPRCRGMRPWPEPFGQGRAGLSSRSGR